MRASPGSTKAEGASRLQGNCSPELFCLNEGRRMLLPVLPQPHEKALNPDRVSDLDLRGQQQSNYFPDFFSCIHFLPALPPPRPTNCPQTHPEHVTSTARKHSTAPSAERTKSTHLACELCTPPHPFSWLYPLLQGIASEGGRGVWSGKGPVSLRRYLAPGTFLVSNSMCNATVMKHFPAATFKSNM